MPETGFQHFRGIPQVGSLMEKLARVKLEERTYRGAGVRVRRVGMGTLVHWHIVRFI